MLSFFKECWILGFQRKAWVPRLCSSISTLAELEFQCLAALCSVWYLFSSRACSSDSAWPQSISSWLMCSLVLSQGCSRNPHVDFWHHPSALLPPFQYPVLWILATPVAQSLDLCVSIHCSHRAWLRLHFPVGRCAGLRAGANVVHTSCAASCFVSENSRVIYFVQFYRCYSRRASLVRVTSSWLEAEVYFSDVLEEDI